MTDLLVDDSGSLFLSDGRCLDPWSWTWREAALPDAAAPIDHRAAVRLVFGAGNCRLVPVAVIGPKQPEDDALPVAEQLGRSIAGLGVPLLCGGRGGVMTAVSKGAREAGGLTIGFLPEGDWRSANDHIAMPLAMGIGTARNVLIAQTALALIAVGGHYGTHTEAAFGLNFGKPVFGLCGAPDIDGVQHMESVDSVIEALLPILLHLPGSK